MVLKILTLFAIGLKVTSSNSIRPPKSFIDKSQIDTKAGGTEWLSSRHQGGPSGTILRLLHYPSIPPSSDFQPSVDIRAGAHSDYGSITLLFQRPGQPGLEIIPPSTLCLDGAKDYSSTTSVGNPTPYHPLLFNT